MEVGAVGHNFERDPARFGVIWFSGFGGKDLNVIFIKICLICIIGINRLKEKFHRKIQNMLLIAM
jgi:hypothetical protein